MEDRVSLVLADCGRTVGNHQRALWELATRLPRSRFHLRVWLSTASAMDEFAHSLEERAILVERLQDRDSRWGWRSRLDVGRRFFHARPELLHLHCGAAPCDRLAGALLEAAGSIRMVVTHDGCEPDAAARPSLRRLVERSDAATAPTAAAAERLHSLAGHRNAAVHVIHDGVDAPDDHAERAAVPPLRGRLGASLLRPLWVCPARLEPGRGHDVLLEALAELHRRGIPFAAVLAGEGPLRDTLERLVEDRGLRGAVRLLGTPEDLGVLLAAADLVVLPVPADGVSHTMMEALVRGRTVVAGAVSAATVLLEDGIHGRLVAPGDPRALATAIEALYRRPEAARRMGAQAAFRMRDEFSWDRLVDEFESVYDDVLGLASFVPDSAPAADDER